MSLKLSMRQVGDVTVMDAVGRMTLGEGSSDFRDKVKELSASGSKKILLNLAEVNYGGSLKLLSLTKRVQDLLQITKLYTVFEVFDDETAAVRSFS
jgi:anti-sigma B factor antagonist